MRIFRPSRFGWLTLGAFLLLFMSAVIHAQGEPPPPPSPTPTHTPTSTPIPHMLTIFRDLDTFTLYAPAQGAVSLIGLAYVVNGENYGLDSFLGFRGLPFDQYPTPVCFRLIRAGANSPLPRDCVSALILTHTLNNADVFWYDAVLGQELTVIVVGGEAFQGFCPSGQSRCEITFTPGDATATQPPTITEPPPPSDGGEACANDFNVPMTHIPQTRFFMGLSDDDIGASSERPGRNVTVSTFCIDTYEVTNARYASCVNEGFCQPPDPLNSQTVTGYFTSPIHARFPVVNVTWDQAQTYCEYRGGRLPTEAEWELVARYDPETGTMRTFPWGNQSPDNTRANFTGKNIGDAVEVGQHPAGVSAYGVHDLSGNVAEWVGDWFGAYNRENNVNPSGPAEGSLRVVRGGSYADDAERIRGGYRGSQSPNVESNKIGFRCVIAK